jgi:hypothetical protein
MFMRLADLSVGEGQQISQDQMPILAAQSVQMAQAQR